MNVRLSKRAQIAVSRIDARWREKGDHPETFLRELFATLKKELARERAFETRATARGEVFEYIETFYNRRRAHSLLDYETPTSFEACKEKSEVA